MGDASWKTAITKIEPNKVLVHGYKIDELMGEVSYAQMVYLILKGELPGERVGKLIDAMLTSSVDHGVTPPSTISAITAASTGAPLNAALACGVLSINRFHGGAIEDCMRMLYQAHQKRIDEDLTVEEVAKFTVKDSREKKKRLFGFGHRIHTQDPRTARLFALAEELNVAGEYVNLIKALEVELEKSLQKKLPVNVDGAIASLLCELGFEPELGNAFFIIARLPGLLAHIQEERKRYKPMRKIDSMNFEYDGKKERRLK